MKLVLIAIATLGAFIAVWIFLVLPAERRHHDRKLEMIRKRIEQRELASRNKNQSESSMDDRKRS